MVILSTLRDKVLNKLHKDHPGITRMKSVARSFMWWLAGDRTMAQNLRPGPNWVTGTVVEVLGPVTYIMETEDGSRWKRHADQLTL